MRHSTIILKTMLIASLAAFAGVVIILAQSYFFVDVFQGRKFEFFTDRGCVYLSPDEIADPTPHKRWQLKSDDDDLMSDLGDWTQRLLGFSWTLHEGKELRIHIVGIPLWFVALFPAVIAARSVRVLHLRRRLMKPLHCRTCGYNLRATPNRCPECGAVAGKR